MRNTTKHVWFACLLLLCVIASGAGMARAQQSGTRCRRLDSKRLQSKAGTNENKTAGPEQATAANSAGPAQIAPANSAALNVSAAANASSAVPAMNARATESLIDESIPDDAALDAMLAPYRAKVRELEMVIGRLEGTLMKGKVVGSSMGNFVTDAMRSQAQQKFGRPLRLAVLNRDGLRKNTIAAGELRVRDVFEILPFENELVAVDLNGAQLRHLLEVLMENSDLAQSGARIKYRQRADGKYETVSLKLIGPGGALEEIEPARTYTIVTVDFIMTRGGAYDFLKEIREAHPLNLKIRDAVIADVKAATAAGKIITATQDGRYDGPGMMEVEIK